MAQETLYEILGVDEDACGAEIRGAHRRLLLKVHPDQGGSDALCRVVQDAYETLCDKEARARYDAERGRGQPSPTSKEYTTYGSARDEDEDEEDPASEAWEEAGAQGDGPGGDGSASAVRPWSRVGDAVAARPSLVLLLAGALLLWAALAYQVFGLGVIAVAALAIALVSLWGRRLARRTDDLRRAGMEQIDVMWGTDFELYLAELFLAEGYDVRHTGRSGDYGADLLLRRSGALSVVQAKRTVKPVGQPAVREAVAARAHYGAQYAMVVTNAVFTPSAEVLAESNDVELWDRMLLAEVAARHSSVPPEAGMQLWWHEFCRGLPDGLRFTWRVVWIAFWLALAVVVALADTHDAAAPRRSRTRRRRRRRR
jgi:restriction system protein